MRARFQILVFPYRCMKRKPLYLILKREDAAYWQGVAGGGEDDESPVEAALRESYEEVGLAPDSKVLHLDSMCTIPIKHFKDLSEIEDTYVIPEYCFGIECKTSKVVLSDEHTEYCWCSYDEAIAKLKWDSNKNALWELNARLENLHRYKKRT